MSTLINDSEVDSRSYAAMGTGEFHPEAAINRTDDALGNEGRSGQTVRDAMIVVGKVIAKAAGRVAAMTAS